MGYPTDDELTGRDNGHRGQCVGPCQGLNVLRDEAHRIAREHGFKDATPAEDIALMHSELSEMLEDIRNHLPLNKMHYEEKTPDGGVVYETMYAAGSFGTNPRKPCGVPSEAADIIIRVLHFCGKHEINIAKAVEEKMKYNDSRPYLHGGKKL